MNELRIFLEFHIYVEHMVVFVYAFFFFLKKKKNTFQKVLKFVQFLDKLIKKDRVRNN